MERAGPQQAAAGRRLLAASEGQLGMLPSLEFVVELEVAPEQRAALLEVLQAIPLRLPRLLTAHGVDTVAAVLDRIADSARQVRASRRFRTWVLFMKRAANKSGSEWEAGIRQTLQERCAQCAPHATWGFLVPHAAQQCLSTGRKLASGGATSTRARLCHSAVRVSLGATATERVDCPSPHRDAIDLAAG